MSISVMLVDDHKMLREGLHQLMEADGDICVTGEASDGLGCLKLLEHTKPDIIVLNINMSKLDGIATLNKIKEIDSEQKVLILTGVEDINILYQVYNMGVNGLVLKQSSYQILVKAVKMIMTGGQYIEPTLIPQFQNLINVQTDTDSKNSIFTKRELQILVMLGEGLYNREMADKLGIAEKTIKNHVTNLYKKIGVSDRTQATVYAIKNGYVNS